MAQDSAKTAREIGELAARLTPQNQAQVLGTLQALLYSQEHPARPGGKGPDEPVPRR